jgi:PAS domain S-box-containing protein
VPDDRGSALKAFAPPLQVQLEWYRAALSRIGDAVITTDSEGRVSSLNIAAEALTGWTQAEAAGVSLDLVFRIISRKSQRAPTNPAMKSLPDGMTVELWNRSVLVAKDGSEHVIDDTAALIRNERNEFTGVVLVFRGLAERHAQEQSSRDALSYADDIIATLREPFMVLNESLQVVTTNTSFSQNFRVTREETVGRFIYELGDRQWDIPKLRTLLEDVLPKDHAFHDFEVEHDFPTLGRRVMLLNARRIRSPENASQLILLAIEDVTELKHHTQLSRDALAYADSIVATLREPFLVLDDQLRVLSVNRAFADAFRVTPDETVGRFIYDLGNRQWDIPRLRTLLEEVLPKDHAFHDFQVDHDFETLGRKVMLFNARRIRKPGDPSELILVAIEDITELQRQEQLSREALAYADGIIATLREPFLVLDDRLKVVTTNRAFSETFRVTPRETIGRFIYDLGNHQWDIPKLRALLEEVLLQGRAFSDFQVEHAFPALGRKTMLLNARRIPTPGQASELVLLAIQDVTELQRQEQLSRDALAYADNIIATLREPFVVLDDRLKVVTTNHAFSETFRVSPEETLGRYIYELGDRQWDIPRLRTLLEEVLPQNHAFDDFEVQSEFPRLGQRTMLLNARRIVRPGNHSRLILLAIEDVTERRAAEHAVRDSEQLFHRLLDKLPAAAYTTDVDGLITYFNQSAARLWGREPRLRDPADRFGGSAKLFALDGSPLAHEALATQDADDYAKLEVLIERTDGSRRSVLAFSTPFYDLAGLLAGAVNVLVDTTARKGTAAAVHDTETRYRRLFQTARDGILILDAKTLRIVDANPFMAELLGYTREEFVGKELWEIGLREDKPASQAAYLELQEKGYIRYDHLPLVTKRGQRVEVEFVSNVYPVDNLLVAQCNVRDISERTKLERKTTEEATALADLHRRKDEFLAMLSHELRNPLAPILNAVHLLRLQPGEDPLQNQARSIIERQVGRLSHLVDDLLEVSRITAGRIHLHQARVSLNGIVEYAVETVRPLIEQRQHDLEVVLSPEPIWIYADAARMEQVVVNLLMNAAKYTDDGGRIALSLFHEDDEAVIRLRDSGVGIAPELLPRIFDLFTQAERSLDRSQGGLGIGLSLVQRLVEMHRGRVEATSTLGQGSQFTVRLPVMQSPEASTPLSDEQTSPIRKSCRVLVVDDNVDAAESMSLLLRASKHDVRMAHDGLAAIEVARAFQPQAVLLDIGLPGLDGHEVAKRLRVQLVDARPVLVAMTGYGQESDRQRSLEAGFDHHLVKPVAFEVVERILAGLEDS